jgi:hypothetical protein
LNVLALSASASLSARRGKGCQPGAHSVAVDAARRRHCAARSRVAPQNSLRSLRSLRSDIRGESVHDARAQHAPAPALRCSSPPNRGLPARAFARSGLCKRDVQRAAAD